MIEFKITPHNILSFEKDYIFLLSGLCLLIEHFATPKKPEILLPKLLIIYWAVKNKRNLDRFLVSKETGFDYLPQYEINSELGNMAIYAILTGFVTHILKSGAIYLALTPKGLTFLTMIHNKNLFQAFRGRIEEIGTVPNSIISREVGLL